MATKSLEHPQPATRQHRSITLRPISYRPALDVIRAVNEAAYSSRGLHEMLERILDRLLEITGFEAGGIRLLEGQSLVLRAHRGVSPTFVVQETHLPLGECFCGRAAAQGRSLVADLSVCPHAPCNQEGFRSAVSVPIQAGERVIGVLHVASRAPNAFRVQEIQLLSTVGYLIGLAIERMRLYTQVVSLGQCQSDTVDAGTTVEDDAWQTSLEQYTVQLRELVARMLEVQEQERARIAHDMHDSIVQLVTGALCLLKAARVHLPTHPEDAQENLARVEKLLQRIEREIRWVIYDLHPVTLSSIGLVSALLEYTAHYEMLSGLSCQVQLFGNPVRLSPQTELAIYRIVQEALQNVAAHAQAQTACVTLNFGAHALQVTVWDDGRGFEVRKVLAEGGKHIGLLGMRERAEATGGQLEVESQPGQGTRIVLTVPYEAHREPG
jgi:signal transduction histidine kinase